MDDLEANAGGRSLVIDDVAFPRSRAGLQMAIDALGPQGGNIFWPAGGTVELDGTPVLIRTGGVRLWFARGSLLRAPAQAEGVLFWPQGTASAPVPLAVGADRGEFAIELQPGGVATLGLRRDAYLYIEDALSLQSHLSVVLDIAGDRVTFADPLSDPFMARQELKAYRLDMLEGIEIHGLRVEGAGSGVIAVKAERVADCSFDVEASGLHNGAVLLSHIYECRLSGAADDCGSVDEASFGMQHFSRVTVDGLRIRRGGFGFGAAFGNHFSFRRVTAQGTAGRGIKIGGSVGGSACADGVLSECEVTGARQGYTGISYTFGSHDIQEIGCRAYGNASSGWWTSGNFERAITVIGGVYFANGREDGGADIAVSDANNGGMRFIGTRYGSRTDYATDTYWEPEPHDIDRHRARQVTGFIPVGSFGGRAASGNTPGQCDAETLRHGEDRSLRLTWQVPDDWHEGAIELFPVYTAADALGGRWACSYSMRVLRAGGSTDTADSEAATELMLPLPEPGVMEEGQALKTLQPSEPAQLVCLELGRHGTLHEDSAGAVLLLGLRYRYWARR